MALKARISQKEFESLPEHKREDYLLDEVSDDYVLQVTPVGGWKLEDIQALTKAHGSVQGSLKQLKEKMALYKLDGEFLDPEEAANAVKKLRTFGNLSPEEMAKEKAKVISDQLTAEYTKEIDKYKQKVATFKSLLESEMVDRRLESELLKVVDPNSVAPEVLLPVLKKYVNFVESDEGFKLQVVDANKGPRSKVVNSTLVDCDLSDLVKEFSENPKYAPLFPPKSLPGGGTSSNRNAASSALQNPKALRSTDKEAINQNLDAIANGTIQIID